MKKQIIHLLLFFVFFSTSCTKIALDQGAGSIQNLSSVNIVKNAAAPNGVLHFNSKADLERIAERIKNEEVATSNIIPTDFKSLANLLADFKKTGKVDNQNMLINYFQKENNISLSTNNSSIIKSMNDEQGIEDGTIDDFITSSYESLVPDDVFQQFLNQDLQIMVGSALYQVTPLGTFEVQLYNIDYFAGWIATNSISIWTNPNYVIPGETSLGGGLYQVYNGIVRQDIDDLSTIATQNAVPQPVVIIEPPTAGPNPSGPEIPMSLVIANNKGEGTGIAGIPGNRRFKFQSYNNGYIIWKSVGIRGKVQRLRRVLWMSYWGQSFADELIVGVDNLDLSTDYFIPTPQSMAAMQMAFPKFKGFKKFKLGNYIADYMAFALGEGGLFLPPFRIPQESISKFFSGNLNTALTNGVNNIMKDIVPAMIDQYVDPTYKDRYKNEPVYFTSYKRITDQTKLRLTAAQVYKKQGYSDNNNWRLDWNIMISNSGEGPYSYDIKSGNFIGKARVGNNWFGIRVVKYKD